MSKIIKTSQVIGKYKIDNEKKVLKSNKNYPKKNTEEKKDKKNNNSQKSNNKKYARKKAENIKINAENRADDIITAAEEKAAEILDRAEKKKKEIEAERKKIFQEERKKGYRQGLKEGRQEIKEEVDSLAELADSFSSEITKEKKNLQRSVINLAVKIAGIIINVKLEEEHEIINNIISDMLDKLGDNHKDIIIKVHSGFLPYIQESKLDSSLKNKNFKFVGDNDLSRGDCIVETNLGGKEGSLQEKLKLIKKELLEEVEVNG
ncbi:MAG: FliH/SctL family protein [Bacillota bacterium]